MKLGTNIHHASEHCCRGFQGHRSKVKVTARPNEFFCDGSIHFGGVAMMLTFAIVYYARQYTQNTSTSTER